MMSLERADAIRRARDEAAVAKAQKAREVMASAMAGALPTLTAEEDAFVRRVEEASWLGQGLRVRDAADTKLRDRLRKLLLVYNRPPNTGLRQVTQNTYFTGLTELGYRYLKETPDAPQS